MHAWAQSCIRNNMFIRMSMTILKEIKWVECNHDENIHKFSSNYLDWTHESYFIGHDSFSPFFTASVQSVRNRNLKRNFQTNTKQSRCICLLENYKCSMQDTYLSCVRAHTHRHKHAQRTHVCRVSQLRITNSIGRSKNVYTDFSHFSSTSVLKINENGQR